VVIAEAVRRVGAASALAIARGLGDGDRRSPQAMQAELERDAWDAITRRASEQAHARAVPPLPAWRTREPASQGDDDEEAMIVCIHGWSVMIETFGFGQPRVIHRNSCDERSEETFDFGWRTMRYVFAAFPDCDWLDPQFFRNDAARLSFCFALSGEVAIAAAATNAIQPFMYDRLASERLRNLLTDDFTITLHGEPAVAGADAAFARWRAYVGAGDYEMGFDVASGAEDNEWRESAQLTLLLFDDAWPNRDETRYAEVMQSWRREEDVWSLQSMQVGPWRTIAFEDED
jgi:hypothetical protein